MLQTDLTDQLAVYKKFEQEAPIRFQTLGQFVLWRAGEKIHSKDWGRDKTVQLIQYLISNRHRHALHKEHIMDHLWEDGDGRDFKVALHGVNKILEPNRPSRNEAAYIERQGLTYQLNLSKVWIDADAIEKYIILGNKAIGSLPSIAQEAYRKAIILYQGAYLPILRFEAPVEKPAVNGLRTGLAIASIYPSAVKGALKGLVTLSRQEAANTTFASIGDLGTRLAGLQISIKGNHNLNAIRPAVFCFNHQSAADFFIIMKLLRKDFTGVAKKELERTPIGPIFTALGAIYIDRGNKAKAIEAMKPAVESLKNGISVAIAPEGTRSGTPELGPFKKGAFHLAIQAGVPIIPIVIKNAYKAMPKGTSLLRPTHIEVVVLDPVETGLWKLRDLNKHIEEVRNMYVTELIN